MTDKPEFGTSPDYINITAKQREWIGVDLDGTLAFYDVWKGIGHIGDPIPEMVLKVKRWIQKGKRVKIFTARASNPDGRWAVQDWLSKNGFPIMEVTNVTDYGMIELWDDRARRVELNTGREIYG